MVKKGWVTGARIGWGRLGKDGIGRLDRIDSAWDRIGTDRIGEVR